MVFISIAPHGKEPVVEVDIADWLIGYVNETEGEADRAWVAQHGPEIVETVTLQASGGVVIAGGGEAAVDGGRGEAAIDEGRGEAGGIGGGGGEAGGIGGGGEAADNEDGVSVADDV